jgi:transcriptional regulator with XRE-family HTH domain
MSQAIRDPAPEAFIKLFRNGMQDQRISLNQLAEQAAISPAFLSRILNRQRGLPADETILRLAHVLNLEPPERALLAAGRIPEDLKPMLSNPQIPLLLRATGKLSETDLQSVLTTAQSLALKHHRKRKRR